MKVGHISMVFAGIFLSRCAYASLAGTVSLVPGGSVVPGLTSDAAGTLLAVVIAPWTSSLGTSSGDLASAVYREAGGTLDFYYQVTDNLTAPNCGNVGQPACVSLVRETDTSFMGYLTFVGYRTDGASLPGPAPFVNGTVAPGSADRSLAGDVVGFSFSPPATIQPGQSSNVLVISTNATAFAAGNASVIDGGTTTVSSFEPAPAVPEPSPLVLFVGASVMVAALRLDRRARRVGGAIAT